MTWKDTNERSRIEYVEKERAQGSGDSNGVFGDLAAGGEREYLLSLAREFSATDKGWIDEDLEDLDLEEFLEEFKKGEYGRDRTGSRSESLLEGRGLDRRILTAVVLRCSRCPRVLGS
ncbi:hypothetical protein CVT25_007965 [Psilocybe cyanescens]|uniref:Uncharacterized protein n=1 Tax=Psilocybe cyanescens TaxID=93625 RepID=A0A409XN17_PSICY|nr:hypothetical protein CVT25_007965 [Psilocybe cyanescens]